MIQGINKQNVLDPESGGAKHISDLRQCDQLTIPSRLTEDEFSDWASGLESIHVEWVNGEVAAMSPASARHVQIIGWLQTILSFYVQERQLGLIFGTDFTVRLSSQAGTSRRIPDLMFIARDRQDLIRQNYLDGAPDWGIEVVSPDSHQRDWTEKFHEYEAAGMKEYWIIDPEKQQFEAFTLNRDGRFESFHNQPRGQVDSRVIAGFKLEVSDLWLEVLPAYRAIWAQLGVL